MKAVVVNWPELRQAIKKAEKLERLACQFSSDGEVVYWSVRIYKYAQPDSPMYRDEEYYQKIKKMIEKKLLEYNNE